MPIRRPNHACFVLAAAAFISMAGSAVAQTASGFSPARFAKIISGKWIDPDNRKRYRVYVRSLGGSNYSIALIGPAPGKSRKSRKYTFKGLLKAPELTFTANPDFEDIPRYGSDGRRLSWNQRRDLQRKVTLRVVLNLAREPRNRHLASVTLRYFKVPFKCADTCVVSHRKGSVVTLVRPGAGRALSCKAIPRLERIVRQELRRMKQRARAIRENFPGKSFKSKRVLIDNTIFMFHRKIAKVEQNLSASDVAKLRKQQKAEVKEIDDKYDDQLVELIEALLSRIGGPIGKMVAVATKATRKIRKYRDLKAVEAKFDKAIQLASGNTRDLMHLHRKFHLELVYQQRRLIEFKRLRSAYNDAEQRWGDAAERLKQLKRRCKK